MVELLNPDLEQARRFLQALDPAGVFTFQTFPENKELRALPGRILHGALDDKADELARLQQQGAGVFVMVNEGNGAGRKSSDVTRVRAQFVDLDGSPIGPALTADAPPHIVVESSPGKWHAYWRVKGASLADFRDRQHALADKFGGDRSVCDLARVMRLPGFWHLKGTPFQTRLVSPTAEVTAQ
ncbi:DNA-primase RepB domain-containing protein [Acidovorax sp. LjRoot38]|uniref:DNA-primase RepB domain-containing protein n=1 Tax=Acidovorax sp. LjRoot38 TaxID=3342327 RepID=UPI003ECFB06C